MRALSSLRRPARQMWRARSHARDPAGAATSRRRIAGGGDAGLVVEEEERHAGAARGDALDGDAPGVVGERAWEPAGQRLRCTWTSGDDVARPRQREHDALAGGLAIDEGVQAQPVDAACRRQRRIGSRYDATRRSAGAAATGAGSMACTGSGNAAAIGAAVATSSAWPERDLAVR